MSGSGCILLLPARALLRGDLSDAPALARALGRGDALEEGEAGELGQLGRLFDILPLGLPAAALSRQHDCGDAGDQAWLRADPAFLQPEMNGVRLMAVGELGLRAEESEALAKALMPMFGEAGMPLTAPSPTRWYLQLEKGSKLPAFSPPEMALGDDYGQHLPHGEEGRRWRALLNEAQVVLHNHPVNQARVAQGRTPANALWVWGGGALPDQVVSGVGSLYSSEPLACALAQLAGIGIERIESDTLPDGLDDCAIDLRGARSLEALESAVFAPLMERVAKGKLGALTVDFGDGSAWSYRRSFGMRFWKRPASSL
ncbi:MAG: phosphoglycerate mutase [Aquimonas sp.]|nr:phosphoglycerate mutase [Aquimonas sp.]